MKVAGKTVIAKTEPKRRARKQDDDTLGIAALYCGPDSAAVTSLKRICEERLEGRCKIEVIDLLLNPQLAKGDQIVAIPTLVRRLPAPIKRIVGQSVEKSRRGGGIRPANSEAAILE